MFRNAATRLLVSEDATEGSGASWLCGDSWFSASLADGVSRMQENQTDDGRSWWCWKNEVRSFSVFSMILNLGVSAESLGGGEVNI